ncbi:hypothetical protein DPEC_G00276560 [Dallia pectoralis]|uniref:Uncharacterized protein n=1 Tax=Dallia pectoralis TaxID=75939 RepID=A0ACC2FLI1_DALPE|nr:hypothetical protein DPEC_G00276560 [Dallia pectoralis]
MQPGPSAPGVGAKPTEGEGLYPPAPAQAPPPPPRQRHSAPSQSGARWVRVEPGPFFFHDRGPREAECPAEKKAGIKCPDVHARQLSSTVGSSFVNP